MKSKLVFLAVSLFMTGFFVQSHAQSDLSGLLPPEKELSEWALIEAPRHAQGDGLFALINGGAELYLKLGFQRAIIADYANKSDQMVTLEIYEMNNPEAAHKLYENKAGKEGKSISLGDAAMFAHYYLNFRQGKFLITLTGSDSKEKTLEGLMAIARIVERRMTKGT
ncbi:MAG: hypothetical protein JRG79_18890 [Deltaproteobacteria bacterium]|nr:hypothetical protein [Deltaproteobacteria bacterium]